MEENHDNEVSILEETIDEKQKFIDNLESKLNKLEQENDRLALREKQLMEEALFNEELILNSAEQKMQDKKNDLLEQLPNPEALMAELVALRQKVKEAETNWAESEFVRDDLSQEVNDALDTLRGNQEVGSDEEIVLNTQSDEVKVPAKMSVQKPAHPSKVTSLLLTCTALSIIYSNRSDIFDAVCEAGQSVSDVVQKYTGIDAAEHGISHLDDKNTIKPNFT